MTKISSAQGKKFGRCNCYHQKLLEHLPQLGGLLGSNILASAYSRILMSEIININYNTVASNTADSCPLLDERDMDILSYITGFIIRRLGKSALSDEFVATEHAERELASQQQLIAIKDRGSLIHPTEKIVGIVGD